MRRLGDSHLPFAPHGTASSATFRSARATTKGYLVGGDVLADEHAVEHHVAVHRLGHDRRDLLVGELDKRKVLRLSGLRVQEWSEDATFVQPTKNGNEIL